MRKVTFGGAVSLDNFLAGPNDAVDWLQWSDEVAAYTTEFWKTIDAVVVGRKTYEVSLRNAQGGGGGDSFPGVKSYVCSRTLASVPEGTTLVRDAVPFLRDLKQQEGRDICIMGGGDLGRSLLEAGLIDEVGLNIHPVLLGAGVPLFHPMPKRIQLKLSECRPLPGGCVLATYRVEH